jgi:3'-5' exoribonuclease
MEKTWVKDVKEGEKVKSLFLVARKATPTAKSGKTYLAVTLQDKTGELEARAFERIEELAVQFEEKDYVEIDGLIGTFQGKPQLRIESVAKTDPATLEPVEFVWVPPPEPREPKKEGWSEADETLWKELQGLLAAVVDPHIKSLLQSFLEDDDLVNRIRRAPAAKTVHHAYAGGLMEHTVSCLKLAHRVADHYPQVDRDLLVAGVFFHDLGKVRELSFERQVEYSDEGRLIGHLVMAAQWIHDKARRIGIPRDLEQHLVHIVLAHHGQLTFGSPKVPMTLEALLTHEIDELDSRVNSWLNLMAREGGTRRWTDSNNIYQQHIWRGNLPTVQAEKKGPAPEFLTPVIYVPRGAAAQPSPSQRPKRPKRERRSDGTPQRTVQPATSGEAPAPTEGARPTTSAPPARPDRPERPPRERRGPGGGHGQGPGGGHGPGDRPRRYMGPRLPGDTGSQPRSDKKGSASLTHNPFAALAEKVGKPEEKPEEQVSASSEEVATSVVAAEAAAVQEPVAAEPVAAEPVAAAPAAEMTPEAAPAPVAETPPASVPTAPSGEGETAA